jgi:hypothetical protein
MKKDLKEVRQPWGGRELFFFSPMKKGPTTGSR